MKHLAAIDSVVLLGYLAFITVLGSCFYRRGATAREYFLGGRRMSWLAAGISLVAADLSAITVMGSTAWHFANNLEIAWISICYPLMAPLFIRLFIPFYSGLNLYTAYEYLERRYSLLSRLIASGLFQVLRAVHVSIALYAPSLVLNIVTGLPVWECILLMGLVTTLYTALGGMKAVIWTDVVQFFTVMGGLILVFASALGRLNVGLEKAIRVARDGDRLGLFNFSTDPTVLTSFWWVIPGGLVLTLGPMATDQALLQRLLTTKSAGDARRSVILQACLVVPETIVLALTGTALYVFYHFYPTRLAGFHVADTILPFFSVHELPHGISGAVVASIFAASMAVMSAGINALTTATTVDFYERVFRPGKTAEHYAFVGRVGTFAWGAFCTVLAMFAGRLGNVMIAYHRIAIFVVGPLLALFLLGIVSPKATTRGTLAGALIGVAMAALLGLWLEWNFYLLGTVSFLASMAAGYGLSRLTPSPGEDHLRGLVHGYTGPLADEPTCK